MENLKKIKRLSMAGLLLVNSTGCAPELASIPTHPDSNPQSAAHLSPLTQEEIPGLEKRYKLTALNGTEINVVLNDRNQTRYIRACTAEEVFFYEPKIEITGQVVGVPETNFKVKISSTYPNSAEIYQEYSLSSWDQTKTATIQRQVRPEGHSYCIETSFPR